MCRSPTLKEALHLVFSLSLTLKRERERIRQVRTRSCFRMRFHGMNHTPIATSRRFFFFFFFCLLSVYYDAYHSICIYRYMCIRVLIFRLVCSDSSFEGRSRRCIERSLYRDSIFCVSSNFFFSSVFFTFYKYIVV